jgi:phage recombination protein Bet
MSNQGSYRNRERQAPAVNPNALTVITPDSKSGKLATALGMPGEYVQLVMDICAKGATDEEFVLFLQVVHDTGLNPLTKEIWFYKMWDANAGRELPVIHASIQGLRKAADKMGGYMPGKETTYDYDIDGKLLSATAYVKRFAGGEWHEISFTAYWAEFGKDVNKWKTMPKHMLGKCAETHALKRAFPRLDALMETEMILTPSGIPYETPPPPPAELKPEPKAEGEDDSRRRSILIDDLDAMAEMMLKPDELAKLRAWTEDAPLEALTEKFHNALSRFTAYARGVHDALPDEYKTSSLEEFNVADFNELDLEALIRYAKTYKDGIGSDAPE